MRVRVFKPIFTVVLFMTAALFSFLFVKSVFFMVGNISHYYWFLGGGAIYFILAWTVFSSNLNFFQTWVHELLHTVMCVLCFHKIEKFEATAHNGGIVYHYGGENILITLAPYTLPLFTFILLILWLMIPLRFHWFQALIGFSLFMHLHAMIKQTRPDQPDLHTFGLPMSYAYILTVLPMNLAICIYAIDMKLWHGIAYLFTNAWGVITSIFGFIF